MATPSFYLIDLDKGKVFEVKGTREAFKRAYCLKYTFDEVEFDDNIAEDGYQFVDAPKKVTIDDII